MFLNITEEDIRADCPHNAPMTLRAFNKISPRQFNTSVSPLNPFEIPRYAPKTVGQFSKALVQQQSGVVNQLTNALSIAAVEEAILAETDPEDFIIDIGFDAPTVEEIDLLTGEEEQKGAEEGEPRLRRTKAQMTESRTMGAEDTRTLQRDQDRMRERVARGAAREGAKEREPPVGLTPPLMIRRQSRDPPQPPPPITADDFPGRRSPTKLRGSLEQRRQEEAAEIPHDLRY